MKQTVAISTFAGMLARQSGYTPDFCERFVIEMFKTVADALKESNDVSIKGLGTFSVDGTGNVSFTPDDIFAADVNAPFDCFEPEPLDDEVTDEILSMEVADNITDDTDDNPDNASDELSEEASPEAKEDIAEVSPETDIADEVEAAKEVEGIVSGFDDVAPEVNEASEEATEDTLDQDSATETISAIDEVVSEADNKVSETEEVSETVAANKIDSATETDAVSVTEAATETDNMEYEPEKSDNTTSRRGRAVWPFVCGVAVGAIIGAAATYFILTPRNIPMTKAEIQSSEQAVAEDLGETVSIAEADSSEVKPTAPIIDEKTADEKSKEESVTENNAVDDSVEYDYVKTTLAQLSRKHYGSYEFWVYIYEENKDVISNPDRVEPNTRVRIPKAEKYGINAKDKNSINNALKKSQEISQRNKSRDNAK